MRAIEKTQKAVSENRRHRGTASFLVGHAAEDCVADHYQSKGYPVAARRWRGASGEIDLVARQGDDIVFVEVKRARTFAQAAERVTARQIQRIVTAASEYLAETPFGQESSVRFDVALVDQVGQLEVLENAFGA